VTLISLLDFMIEKMMAKTIITITDITIEIPYIFDLIDIFAVNLKLNLPLIQIGKISVIHYFILLLHNVILSY